MKKDYMNLETLNPVETYKSSKKRYHLFSKQILSFYDNYQNKNKISILLEFWLWNIRITHKLYGNAGLKEFLNGEIANPSRFARFKDTQAKSLEDSVVTQKKNKFLFFILAFLVRKFLLQGAHLKSIKQKIISRLTLLFIKTMPIEEDVALRIKIVEISMKYFSDIKFNGLEQLLYKKLPNIFCSKPIAPLSFHKKGVMIECAAACFLEFHNYENIFLLNNSIYIKGIQHGGGYDTFLIDYFADYEIFLCNEFVGWGLYSHNSKQPKFKKFSEKQKNESLQKRIIWIEDSYLPSYFYMIMPYHHYQSKDVKSTGYISRELKALECDYYNLSHPVLPSKKYESYRGKLLHRSNNRGESLFLPMDIGIFDNSGATLIHFFVENEMPFIHIISKSDFDRFTMKQKEWFNVLYDNGMACYNDEKGKLALNLEKIMKNNYAIPKELVNYHNQVFKSN